MVGLRERFLICFVNGIIVTLILQSKIVAEVPVTSACVLNWQADSLNIQNAES